MKPALIPPFYQAIPLSPDDCLYVEGIAGLNNCICNIQGSAINMKGELVNFNEVINIATPGVVATKIVQLGYSFLISVTVATYSLTIPDGDVFVRMSLVNPVSISPYFRRKILDQGYVSTYAGLSYGTGSVSKRTSNPTFYRNIETANPAAGVDLRYDIPSFVQVYVMSISFTLVCSAAVAVRYPGIALWSPTNKVLNFTTDFNQPASSNFNISYNATARVSSVIGPNAQCAFAQQFLGPGCSIRSSIFNIQAADQISNVCIHVMQQTLPSAI